MKAVRLFAIFLVAVVVVVVITFAWRTARTRAFLQASQPIVARPLVPIPQGATPLASVQQSRGSQSSALASPMPAAAALEKQTEERLGPFSISGNNYTVVLHKKHLAADVDEGEAEADGVVALEIVDATGAVLYRRTYPLWANAESVSTWRIFAHILSGTNGTGLLVKSSPNIDPSEPDPESHVSYEQIFGVVNGKFVPFSGPFSGMLGKADANAAYRTAGALGPQADEIRVALGTGRFVMVVPVRLDWIQGKLTLAPQCPDMAAGDAHAMCEYQLLNPSAFLQRPKDATFVRLYSSPDENSGRPARVVVKPASQIEILAYRTVMVMKQPDPLPPPSPTDFPVKDRVQIGPAPNTDAWLQVRIDGRVGWIHSDEDLTAVGLPEPGDEIDPP